MQSFVDLDRTFAGQPRELGAVLARIDTGRGQERLFEDQRPELLKQLAEHARIASITASNAIEGVVVDGERAQRIAEGSGRYRNRNEREFAGYRDAIDMLMRLDSYEPLSVPFLLHLHRLLFQYTDGNGGNLKSDENLIVSYESGSKEVIFTPPPPEQTESRTGSATTSCARRLRSSAGAMSSAPFPASVWRRFASFSPSFATRVRSGPKARAPAPAGAGSDLTQQPRLARKGRRTRRWELLSSSFDSNSRCWGSTVMTKAKQPLRPATSIHCLS